MLYYIYIGTNRIIIDHLSKITGGMFVAVSSSQKAAKVIDGIRERYNISILYEQTDVREADCIEISYLRKRYPRVYITLITEALKAENRKNYLQAGVNNTLPPHAEEESIQRMNVYLRARKESKLKEFSETHRKVLNTFRLPLWKRTFDVLFAGTAVIILSPLLIGTAVAIRLESKGKIIYKSQRVGSNYQSTAFEEAPGVPGAFGRLRVNVNQFINSETAYTILVIPIMINAVERTPVGLNKATSPAIRMSTGII